MTGAVFVDLSTAYDTVNRRISMNKIYQMTDDKAMTTLLGTLLKNNVVLKNKNVLCRSESEEKLMAATTKWPPSRQCFSPVAA